MRKNSQKAFQNTERTSLNKENLHPLQAHYQQYLQQQRSSKFAGSQTNSNYSNNQFQSSDLSLSQSGTSEANNTQRMIDSQRSSRLNMSKKSLPNQYMNFQPNNSVNSASMKGTPSFQNGVRAQKHNINNNIPSQATSKASMSNQNSQNTVSFKSKKNLNHPPMVVEFTLTQNDLQLQQQPQKQNQKPQKGSSGKRSSNQKQITSMQKQHQQNQPSISSNSSAQVNQHFQQTNKHLRFDSIQDSSSATNQQMMSITSQHYQGLISGGSSEEDNNDDNYQDLKEMMMESPQPKNPNQITLNNSLLECVDQYGNNIDQYSVLIETDNNEEEEEEEEEDEELSSKKQQISELNDPNSYLNTVTKDVQLYGSINHNINQYPISNSNNYNSNSNNKTTHTNIIQLQNNYYLSNNPNFIVCSPSANTDDDCQYTNSSAVRSIATANSAIRNHYSYGKTHAHLIYTDERKEEDLSSQAIDEQDDDEMNNNEDNIQQFSSDKDQFTHDNGEDDEEIESKLHIATGSSQLYQTKDYDRSQSSGQYQLRIKRDINDQLQQTPAQQNQFLQILDSDQRQRIINDTPQVMEMIDQSNIQSTKNKSSKHNSGNGKNNQTQNIDQISPEVLGSRENRRRVQKQLQQDKKKDNKGDNTRNSSRYLNFKDISPLVKSCNTFAFDNMPNQSNLDINLVGKISPPFLQNHYPSVIQKGDNFKFNTINSNNVSYGHNTANGGGMIFMQTNTNVFGNTIQNHYYQTTQTQGTMMGGINENDMCSPDQLSRGQMTNKLSSVIESPPPLTDMTPEKGIKDFSRQYLNQGMWPSKTNHLGDQTTIMHQSKLQDASLMSSRLNISMKMGDNLRRIESNLHSQIKHPNSNFSTHQKNQQQILQSQHMLHQSMQKKFVVPPLTNLSNALFSTADGMLTQSQTNQTFSQNQINNSNNNINMSSNHQNNISTSNPYQIQEKLSSAYPNIDISIVQKINTTLDNMNNQFYFKRPSDHVGLGNSSITQLRTSREQSKHNLSGFTLLNNFNHPNQINANKINTMVNNTVFNQSSFDDMCNIHGTNENPQNITHIQNEQLLPLTSRSHNQPQLSFNNNRFSNISDAKNTHTHDHMTKQCKECIFEREKRSVTQKAFERALGISLYLMEEIDKISLNQRERPSNHSEHNQMQISRQEIMNLMNQTHLGGLKGLISPNSLNGSTTHQNSQTRLSRSKSQSMMPVEFANLQRSLQIPRGALNSAYQGIFNNATPNMSYI